MKQEEYKFYQNFDSRDDLKQFETNALLMYSLHTIKPSNTIKKTIFVFNSITAL